MEAESCSLLRAMIKIIESHAVHHKLTAESVRITVPGEHVFACFALILVSTGHKSHGKAVQLGRINAEHLLQQGSQTLQCFSF